jgi:hypothetical protein
MCPSMEGRLPTAGRKGILAIMHWWRSLRRALAGAREIRSAGVGKGGSGAASGAGAYSRDAGRWDVERPAEQTVHAMWGPRCEELPACGMTVAEVRALLLRRGEDVGRRKEIFVNGTTAEPQRRLLPGDIVEFWQNTGEMR